MRNPPSTTMHAQIRSQQAGQQALATADGIPRAARTLLGKVETAVQSSSISFSSTGTSSVLSSRPATWHPPRPRLSPRG